MKKLLLLFLVFGLFACSSDSEEDTDSVDDTNPVYLDANGVTIKARDWAVIGDSGTINGKTYTIVNNDTFRIMAISGELLDYLCTTRVTNLGELYLNGTEAEYAKHWDVSNVVDMSYLFDMETTSGSHFNEDISYWDVSNVLNMKSMFRNNDSFNQDISSWDVSSVTDMEYMFTCATAFNQDLSSWNVENVTDCSDWCECMENLTPTWNLPNFTNCNENCN